MTSASGRKISQANVRLDALFDYSKIRPSPIIALDDDDDDDVQIITPPQPSTSGCPQSSTELESGKENPVKGDEAVKVVDDNDWLEPPSTTMAGCHRVLPADPTLLKIRQQKQELENIWQASVKNIEEASRLEARVTEAASQKQADSSKRGNAQNGPSEEAPNKRQKILLKLQGESGESHGVRIYVDDKLDKLFTHYANNLGKRPKTDFVFRFDGQQLDANSSPKDLELEDEDIVEVHVKKGARR